MIAKRYSRNIFVVMLVSLMFSTPRVLANQHSPFSTIMNEIGNVIFQILYGLGPLFQIVLGEEFNFDGSIASSEPFLINFMIFTLLFVFIYLALCRTPFFEHSDVSRWIVTIVVTVLGTRWLFSENTGAWVQAILLPYSVLGVSITAFLPILFYFWFVEFNLGTRMLRRSAWIFFAVIYAFLWFGRRSDFIAAQTPTTALYIYPVCLFLCAIFFAFDGTIQQFKHKVRLSKINSRYNEKVIIDLESDRVKVRKLYHDALTAGDSYNAAKWKKELDSIDDKILDLSSK